MAYTAITSMLSKLSTFKKNVLFRQEYIKKKKVKKRHAASIFTIDEIAKKFGVSKQDLMIIDNEDNYNIFYNGARPEDFGEIF